VLAKERYQEILGLLKPGELVVVALKLEFGMDNRQVSSELGITHQAVAYRIHTARKRIAVQMPELVRQSGYKRNDNRLWREREMAFIWAMADLEARGDVPALPTIGQENGWPDHTVWRVWSRVRENGWAVQKKRTADNTRPVALTDKGREILNHETG